MDKPPRAPPKIRPDPRRVLDHSKTRPRSDTCPLRSDGIVDGHACAGRSFDGPLCLDAGPRRALRNEPELRAHASQERAPSRGCTSGEHRFVSFQPRSDLYKQARLRRSSTAAVAATGAAAGTTTAAAAAAGTAVAVAAGTAAAAAAATTTARRRARRARATTSNRAAARAALAAASPTMRPAAAAAWAAAVATRCVSN
ncbi:hypothetical protein M885DRAFT_95351 [Pelagophyceae sp. CCMP2097]|nr:hypothetical protein M885DRAFT_95351 [Pelagophyceae sp. CCMP2097]